MHDIRRSWLSLGPALDRRSFLAAALAGLAVGSLSGGMVAAAQGGAPAQPSPDNGGYGELRPAGPHLALPAGFRYVAFGGVGTPMADGTPTPGLHDGMGVFRGADGLVRLVRNHEIDHPGSAFGRLPYDPAGAGGTTTMVFHPVEGRLLRSFPSLTGTTRNCSGGTTPWGTWISCEETTAGKGEGFTKPHGYCFEVDPWADGPRPARPLRAMGRFAHEAVAVDPATGVVYETEDRNAAGFYRFLPEQRGHLEAGGRLQMLAVDSAPHYDTRRGQNRGVTLPVRWVDIPEPDPAAPWANPVCGQGRERGGAVFARLEGCCWSGNQVFFTSTTGGEVGAGQVWAYRPAAGGGTLRLVFESSAAPVMEAPDNISVSPRGGIVLCEDCPGADRLLGIDRQGRTFEFARNLASSSEFAGAVSFLGGRWLFVNVQHPGLTLAITGPWRRGCL